MEYFEQGTWNLSDSVMHLTNLTQGDRSVLDGGRVRRLYGNTLILEFLVPGTKALEQIMLLRMR
jgi:hypothetical protein